MTEALLYPDDTKKNKEAALIHWFYTSFLGKTPDATHYASGTKILSGILRKSKKYPDARVYTLKEVADLFYYLRRCGINRIDLTILKFPNLLSAYTEGEARRLDDIVAYLKKGDSVDDRWTAPEGW